MIGAFDTGLAALGIVTPPAVQRTTFEKDGGANAGAVMNGKMFDIEDDSVNRTIQVFFICCF